MSDQDGKKPLGLSGGARSGQVKQSFARGRTKSVVVETKRKRVMVPKAGNAGTNATAPTVPTATDAEMDRRLKALQAAKAREADEAERRAREEQERAEERQRRRDEAEAKERAEREREEAIKQREEDEKRRKEEAAADAKRSAEAKAAPAAAAAPAPAKEGRPAPSGPRTEMPPRRKEEDRGDKRAKTAADDRRRSGKLTVNQALTGGEGGRQRSMAAMKRKQERQRQKAMGGSVEREKIVREVQLPEAIVVSELANRMAERVAAVVKSLMNAGIMATQNQVIDAILRN